MDSSTEDREHCDTIPEGIDSAIDFDWTEGFNDESDGVEGGGRKESGSGSRDSETIATTSEPKFTEVLSVRSKVPEIPRAPEN
eukprot:9495191-Pyramimonas_sp.AAC.1